MKRTKKEYGFIVLCLDPSFTAFGWSVISNDVILDSGCIKTQPTSKKLRIRVGDDEVRRINLINIKLKSIIKDWKICYIVSELPHGSQSAKAAMALGLVKGITQTIADMLDIGIEWFSESDSKQIVLGKPSGEKSEMIDKIDELYNVPWTGTKYIDEAVADSIAIHYTAKQISPFIKHMLK